MIAIFVYWFVVAVGLLAVRRDLPGHAPDAVLVPLLLLWPAGLLVFAVGCWVDVAARWRR